MKDLPLNVYTAQGALSDPKQLAKSMRADLNASFGLGWRLAVRDINAQYRQSILGFLWLLIIPMTNTAVWVYLNASGLVRVGSTELPYIVFVFTGTVLWSILIDAINAPLQQVNANRALLAKINFPREALIISGVLQTIFSSIVKVALLLIVLPLIGITPGWGGLLIPLGLLSLIILGTALGLLITPIGMLYGDVGRGIPLITQFLMYLSPVVYPISITGWSGWFMAVNPLTPIIINARAWFTGLPSQHTPEWTIYFVGSTALLFIVWITYRVAMPILIERMSA